MMLPVCGPACVGLGMISNEQTAAQVAAVLGGTIVPPIPMGGGFVSQEWGVRLPSGELVDVGTTVAAATNMVIDRAIHGQDVTIEQMMRESAAIAAQTYRLTSPDWHGGGALEAASPYRGSIYTGIMAGGEQITPPFLPTSVSTTPLRETLIEPAPQPLEALPTTAVTAAKVAEEAAAAAPPGFDLQAFLEKNRTMLIAGAAAVGLFLLARKS